MSTKRRPAHGSAQAARSELMDTASMRARCFTVRPERLVQRFGYSVTVREIACRLDTRVFRRVGLFEKRV
jgi:hypothetical protein